MSLESIKKGKHLLLSGILASAWLWAMPAEAQRSQQGQQAQQVSDAQVNAMVEALRKGAPPNKSNDGMYSQWQVLPAIIPSWTKQCVGREMTPDQFESDATAARNTVACIVRREFNTQYRATGKNETASVRNVACWWMTGNTGACTSGYQATYADKVVGFYQQQARSNNTSPASQPAAREQPAAKPTQEPAAKPTQEPAAKPTQEPATQP